MSAIKFQSSPRTPGIKLLKTYTTISGHQFREGTIINGVTPNADNQIALRDPRSGAFVFFGRSEWM